MDENMGNLEIKILKTVNFFIISVIVLFAILLVGVKIFGIDIYTVLSGSMEPTYKVGSLIYVTTVNEEELEIGDAVTYKISETLVATHRIVDIVDENGELKFETKGDANKLPDEKLISSEQIVGEPIFTIPYLGYVATFLQTKRGKVILIISSVILIGLVMFIDSVVEKKKIV